MMKHFTHHLLIRSLLCLAALTPLVSNALDLTFVPRVQAGVMNYEFEKKPRVYSSGKNSGYKLSSPMPFVSGGVTAFLNSFFVDVYLQKAFSGSDGATETSTSESFFYVNETQIDAKFDRNEYSLSAGYAIGKQWIVFGGYRKAKMSFTHLEASLSEGRGEYENTTVTYRNLEVDVNARQDGYFLGVTYALSVSEQSVISLNVAIAALDGKHHSSHGSTLITSVFPDGREETRPTGKSVTQFDGNSVGLNLGIKWKGRIDNNYGYNFGLNGYTYDFDGIESEPNKIEQTYSETVLSLSAGLSYEF